MRKILLAAFVAVAATQLAPAANAVCVESRGGSVHIDSGKCAELLLDLCALVPDVHVTNDIGVECE